MAYQQAGWYPDPLGDVSKLRYWDGDQWTNDYTDASAVMQPAEPSTLPTEPFQPLQQDQPFQPQPLQQDPYYQAQPAQAMPAAIPVQHEIPGQLYQAQYPPQQTMQMPGMYGQPKPSKGKVPGIIALVLGIIGLILAWIPIVNWVSFPLVIAGLVLGIVSLVMASGGKGPKGFGIAGLIISAVALVLTIVMTIIMAIAANTLSNSQEANDLWSALNEINDLYGNGSNSNYNYGSTNTGSNYVDEYLSGSINCQVGTRYSTRWFDFTVNNLAYSNSIPGVTASNGNTLLLVNVTITNTFGSTQPFGTFDWYVQDSRGYYWDPMYPLPNTDMMPDYFDLEDGHTVNYDLVIEIPNNLNGAYFMYTEVTAGGDSYNSFVFPIKY